MLADLKQGVTPRRNSLMCILLSDRDPGLCGLRNGFGEDDNVDDDYDDHDDS